MSARVYECICECGCKGIAAQARSLCNSCWFQDCRENTAYIYAVGYPANMVYDPTWVSEADVIGSFHGGYYVTAGGQVTGTLLRAVVGSDEWVEL